MIRQEMKVLQTRIPAKLYEETAPIFDDMGMNVNDGIRVFLTYVRNKRQMPFAPEAREKEPNERTLIAMNETGRKVSWDDLHAMVMGPGE